MFHLTGAHPESGNWDTSEAAMTAGIRELWQQGLLLDYTIKVEDQEFPAHKLALAAMSDYFKVMLTGNMKESQETFVQLKGVSAIAMQELLQYIYTRKFDLSEDNCTEVLAGAVHLQIHTATVACCKFLVDNLSVENCLDILEIIRLYNLTDIEDKVLDFIKRNAQGIIRMGRFDCVHFKDMGLLINEWYGSEWDLFLCIKQWIYSDPVQRSVHTDSLMVHVRFSLMSVSDLQNVIQMGVYAESEGTKWRELVQEALSYHLSPVWERVTKTSTQSQIRNKPMVVAFSADSDDDMEQCSSEFLGLHDDWCWRKLPNMSHTFPQASVTVVNNFLFVAGGCHPSKPLEPSKDCFIFDPRVMSWFPVASMDIGRIHFPIVECDQKLYSLGGCYGYGPTNDALVTSKSEVFNVKTNTWSSIHSLPMPLRRHSACSHQGFLYVSGGLSVDFAHSGSSRHLSCYDVANNIWQPKAPMTQSRFGHSMFPMKLDGQDALFVVGLNLDVEYYSFSENQWTRYILPYSASLPSYGNLVFGGDMSIYVIAGSALFENVHVDLSDNGEEEDDDVCSGICVKFNLDYMSKGEEMLNKLPNYPAEGYLPLCAMLCLPTDIIDASSIIPPVTTQLIS